MKYLSGAKNSTWGLTPQTDSFGHDLIGEHLFVVQLHARALALQYRCLAVIHVV